MAHEITTRDNLFTVRNPSWHGLEDACLEDYPTREEAQAIAHPWEPVDEPIFRRVPVIAEDGSLTHTYEEIEEFKGTARSDDNYFLGVRGSGHELVKNEVMYDIAEAIEGEAKGSVMFETGGSLKGGRKVWLLIRLRDPLMINGDPHGGTIPYFALQNAHDGSGSFRGQATMTRIVCHEVGTPMLHEGRWISVEEHPSVQGTKREPGLAVHIAGMPNPEVVTLDHRYQTAEGWLEAQNLVKGVSEVAYPIDQTVIDHEESEDFWWAVGLWWADGHLHGSNQVTWTVSDPQIEDRLMSLLRERGFSGDGSTKRGCRQITYAWPEFREIVEPMYRGEGRGKGRREKVPTELMEKLPPHLQSALIAGYFDGDGSWDKQRGGMIFSSASLDGLLALRRMLARQGRPSLIRRGRKAAHASTIEGRAVTARDQYSLRVPENPKDVRIENGVLFSRVRLVEWAGEREFVPITTDDHTYITHFGQSHNCDNTAQMADLDAKQRGTEFVFRHTKNIDTRIEEAKYALAGWRESVQAYQLMMDALTATPIERALRYQFVERLIPMPAAGTTTDRVRENVRKGQEEWLDILESVTCEGVDLTAAGLVHASVEYLNHGRKAHSNESRFTRNYLSRDKIVSHAVKITRELVGV